MKTLFAVLLALVLVGCASMMGEQTVSVTGAQIQEKLNEKLASPLSLLKIFDVNFSNALVTFDQGSGRMHTTLDADLSSQLFGETLSGSLGISGKLRFDATTYTIVLDAPAIDTLNFGDFDAKKQYQDLLNALAKTMTGDVLNGIALYTIKPEDLRFAGTQYVPKTFLMTSKGLQITLTPQ